MKIFFQDTENNFIFFGQNITENSQKYVVNGKHIERIDFTRPKVCFKSKFDT